MKTLREFICYNQKQVIKFEYLISNLHKEFKDLYNSLDYDEETVSEAYEKLNIDGFILMNSIFKKNMEFIQNTIGILDEDLRFTIKIVHNDKTLDIFRSHEINSLFYESDYNRNTAFEKIMDSNEKSYWSNDLEDDFKLGNYKNPRILEKNRELLIDNKIQWEECWLNYENHPTDTKDASYYNSTLVLPMSITSNDEDKTSIFYHDFFNTQDDIKRITQTRAIWGFACFDSKKKNLFNELEKIDIDFMDLGYIISDILSLYLVFYYNYTSSSSTIIEYEKYLAHK